MRTTQAGPLPISELRNSAGAAFAATLRADIAGERFIRARARPDLMVPLAKAGPGPGGRPSHADSTRKPLTAGRSLGKMPASTPGPRRTAGYCLQPVG